MIAILVSSAETGAAERLILAYQEVVSRVMPGMTAAFSLSSCVGVSVREEEVTLTGRRPCRTHLVVVRGDGEELIPVTVQPPEPSPIARRAARNVSWSERGMLETRFGSNPNVLQNTARFSSRDGDKQTDLAITTATPFDRSVGPPLVFPLATYRVQTPNREVTLLDSYVSNSPLTVSGSNVRGLHIRDRNLEAHIGYSFFSTFENVLLPTRQELVAGVGYKLPAGSGATLTPNFYLFGADPLPWDRNEPKYRPLGSLVFEAGQQGDTAFLAELAVGDAVGGAVELTTVRGITEVWAKARLAPNRLPSLTTDRPQGHAISGGWTRRGLRVGTRALLSSHKYDLPAGEQWSTVSSLGLDYRLGEHWLIQTAPGYSQFRTQTFDQQRTLSTVTLPASLDFDRGGMGGSVRYQFSREDERNQAGHLFGIGLRGTTGSFRLSLLAERQTQAPTVGHILVEVPWLGEALDRFGIQASSPSQIAELLRTTAFLSSLGFSDPLSLNVAPVRKRFVANLSWLGGGPQRRRVSFNALTNMDDLITGASQSGVYTATYSQRLFDSSDVFGTFSMVCNKSFGTSGCRPVASIALRQNLSRVPRLFAWKSRGNIEGHVFLDRNRIGLRSTETPPLSNVRLVLDGQHTTQTDKNGRYRFSGVGAGSHHIEVKWTTDRPFFFTTPSPARATIGSTVDFGITFEQSRLIGTVVTDAGIGLEGVAIHLRAPGRNIIRTVSGGDGSFSVEGVPPGEYEVLVEPGSVPPGYELSGLEPRAVSVGTATRAEVGFVIGAYRTVGGRVRIFNRATGTYEPLRDAAIEIEGQPTKGRTDEDGAYLFRDLPPGDHRLVVTHAGASHPEPVTLDAGPASLRNVDIDIIPPPTTDNAGCCEPIDDTLAVAVAPQGRDGVTSTADWTGAGISHTVSTGLSTNSTLKAIPIDVVIDVIEAGDPLGAAPSPAAVALEHSRSASASVPEVSLEPTATLVGVAPFANASGGTDDWWIGKFVQEAILVEAASTPGTPVIDVGTRAGRVSTRRRDDQTLLVMCRQRNVTLVITGNFERTGDQVRVAVQIVDVQTGTPLQAMEVNGDLNELVPLQDLFAQVVAEALSNL